MPYIAKAQCQLPRNESIRRGMVGAAQHRRCGGDGAWVPQAGTAIALWNSTE